MGFLDWFRRPPPIGDSGALADFVDQRAAFVAQKGIYEYSRARAGHYSKVLFSEPDFLAAAEQSSWQAYPLALALVGEMVEGVLRPHFGDDRRAGLDQLTALVLAVFDRHPVPASLGQGPWSQARSELARRMNLVGIHPPKPVKDIPENLAESYFAVMPIHEKLRGRDFPTIRNYLRVTLCNIHDELTERTDVPALVVSLRASADADADEPAPGSAALR